MVVNLNDVQQNQDSTVQNNLQNEVKKVTKCFDTNRTRITLNRISEELSGSGGHRTENGNSGRHFVETLETPIVHRNRVDIQKCLCRLTDNTH